MAVRSIPGNRRSLTGLISSGETEDSIPFESSLERDFVILTKADLRVKSVDSQPVRVHYDDPRGVAHIYTPDYLVTYHPPEIVGQVLRPLLVEVKYLEDIRTKWPEYRQKWRAAIRYAKKHDWGFIVRTERRIRTPRLKNVTFLRGFKSTGVSLEDQRVVLDALYEKKASTPQELIESITPDRWRQAYHLHVVWNVIANSLAGVDLDKPLTQHSKIWNIEPAWELMGDEP